MIKIDQLQLLHEDAFEIHEESWNAYPYCKTICTNPKYMKDNFYLCIESIHLEDDGDVENVRDNSNNSKNEVLASI